MNTFSPASLAALARGDIANALVAAIPGGIERQEAEGQRALASAFRTLPKDMDREAAEAFGFTFGEDADEIFVSVTAPEGWSIRPTDHSMHSDIVDDQGRVRGSIFYKAAFYDRRATGNWSTRYRVEQDHGSDYVTTAVKAVDTATGETLKTEPLPAGDEPYYERAVPADATIRAYLDGRFPDWKSVTAYW